MRAPWLGITAVSLALAAATTPFFLGGFPLGEPGWHHAVSLLVTLGLFLLGWWVGRSDSRRHLALSVALWTSLAIVSGFLILYLKPDLKASGYKDWAKFWHVAWSWLALWAFAGHTWVNRLGLARAWKRLSRGLDGTLHYGLLAVVLVSIPVTWSALGARALQEPQYIPLTLYTWLGVTLVSYGLWWVLVARRRDRAVAAEDRRSWQPRVDILLLHATLLVNLSGFPLLWFNTKATDLKYVAKYWHTAPSIVMAVVVFAHAIQFLPGLLAHWRRRTRNA